MARRLGTAYFWIAQLLAVSVGRLRDLVGAESLICGYAVFVAVTATAVWKVGAAKADLAFGVLAMVGASVSSQEYETDDPALTS